MLVLATLAYKLICRKEKSHIMDLRTKLSIYAVAAGLALALSTTINNPFVTTAWAGGKPALSL
jgi:hypothetical protein